MARPDTERLGKSVEVSLGALRLVGACFGQAVRGLLWQVSHGETWLVWRGQARRVSRGEARYGTFRLVGATQGQQVTTVFGGVRFPSSPKISEVLSFGNPSDCSKWSKAVKGGFITHPEGFNSLLRSNLKKEKKDGEDKCFQMG